MEKEPDHKLLTVTNRMDELNRVAAFVEELGEEWELSMHLVYILNLSLEEALSNIIQYGFDDDHPHLIEINFRMQGAELSITIIDDGHPYDPTLRADPDITLPAEERPVGGLGIFLIRKLMDQVEYRREENKNSLILTKSREK